MKNISKVPKIITILSIFFLIFMFFSFKDKKSDHIGSYDASNSCKLISDDDIRSVFHLNEGVEIVQSENFKVCYYKWKSPNEEKLEYTVRFAYALHWEQKSTSEMDKTWEEQNETVYKKYNIQNVPDVGDKASWSDYENGQLRVTEDGYFFYISIYVEPKNESSMKTQDLIEKTSALAKRVIENM